jgi:hypothetical protein
VKFTSGNLIPTCLILQFCVALFFAFLVLENFPC